MTALELLLNAVNVAHFHLQLVMNHFKSKEDLEDFMTTNVGVFEDAGRSGCILLLYSVIFSRTIDW